jgi:hypothetical protein
MARGYTIASFWRHHSHERAISLRQVATNIDHVYVFKILSKYGNAKTLSQAGNLQVYVKAGGWPNSPLLLLISTRGRGIRIAHMYPRYRDIYSHKPYQMCVTLESRINIRYERRGYGGEYL